MTASSSDGAPSLLALPSTERDTAQASAVHSTENVRVPNASTSSGAMEQALSKFKGGVDSFQELINSLLQATQREREELERGRQQLELERSAFEEEATRVQHVLTDSETVVLNVGGVKFTTSVTTLRNAPAPSLFNAMFSGRHTLRKDASGCVFIDRDGRHFADVLNYLRDGRLNYPPEGSDYKYLLELRSEAEFYGLTGLVRIIDRYPWGMVKVSRASSLNCDYSWMYEDGQDEVVFSVDRPCQLLGAGLCGTEGGFTVELEVYEVAAEDFTREVCTLAVTAQSFTKDDGRILRLMLPDPVSLEPAKFYMLSALIKGAESACCEDCLDTVVASGVTVRFQSWESPNGTNEQRGQFPELYLRPMPSLS